MTHTTWRRFASAIADTEGRRSFAVIAAMTIAMAARNAVEDSPAAGMLSDAQAPTLDRQLRNRAYEVMLVIERLRDTLDSRTKHKLEAFLLRQASVDGERGAEVEPISAIRGAIRQAAREFARSARLTNSQASELENTAASGADTAYRSWETIGRPASLEDLRHFAAMIPSTWQLPEIRASLLPLFERDEPGLHFENGRRRGR